MKNYIYTLFAVVFFHVSALATTTNNTDTVIINTYQEQYSVKPYIFAANANTNWHFSTETIKWLNKTTLKEITASDTLLINQWYVGKLIIKSAINIDLQLGLHLSNANIQEFYLPVSGVTRSTGSNITRYKNDELFSHSDIVSVPISANSITEIYFRFFSYEPIFVSPALYQLNYIQRVGSDREVDEFSSRSFFLGSFLLLLIISLIVVIFNRRRAYLYYSVYVLCVGFINSSFDSFFEVLSISGRYSFFVGELLGGLAWISYFLFIQNFLQTKRYFPPWHKIMNFIIVAVVVFVLMIIVLLGWQNDKMLYLKYRNAYTLLIFLLSLPIFIRFVFSKRQIAIIVGSGGVITLLCWIAYLGLQFWAYKNLNIVRGGQLLEIVLFGMAIAMQVSELYSENVRIHKDIIQQKEDRNKELEIKVLERTTEISLRNAELQMQSEENLSQNELLQFANTEITKQKEEIELTYRRMTNSVLYAKRIQNAVFYKASSNVAFFSDYFLYFAPRDIVSGDFYYIRTIENQTFLAVGDCTGHGVPGGFMSILGITLLDEAVRSKSHTPTGAILNELRDQIKLSLMQEGRIGEQKDGIDLALCRIDNHTLELEFSGALRPCWILRKKDEEANAEYEIIVLEPDKMPIGIYVKERSFKSMSFQLKEGDRLYLFSDGYSSQFAKDSDDQIKTKGFKSLLLSICQLPLTQQKEALKAYLHEWKGKKMQTDDILVLGLKV